MTLSGPKTLSSVSQLILETSCWGHIFNFHVKKALIILTATESSFVFEQTQISGNLEQSFLHLSLRTYPNNWDDVRVGQGQGEEGTLPELSWLALFSSHTHQLFLYWANQLSKASLNFCKWVAVWDLRTDNNSPVGEPGLPLDSSTC